MGPWRNGVLWSELSGVPRVVRVPVRGPAAPGVAGAEPVGAAAVGAQGAEPGSEPDGGGAGDPQRHHVGGLLRLHGAAGVLQHPLGDDPLRGALLQRRRPLLAALQGARQAHPLRHPLPLRLPLLRLLPALFRPPHLPHQLQIFPLSPRHLLSPFHSPTHRFFRLSNSNPDLDPNSR